MSLYYVRLEDGTIMDNCPITARKPLREHRMVFARKHFDQAIQSIVSHNPVPPEAKNLNVGVKTTSELWMELKQFQYQAKGKGTGCVMVQCSNTNESLFFKLVLILLRLRLEFEHEARDGLPEIQIIVSEISCERVTRWLKTLSPVMDENEKIHMAHLMAFGKLFKAQIPNMTP